MSAALARMVALPNGLISAKQRAWARWHGEPYGPIAAWCLAHGHPALARSLTRLYQRIRSEVRRRDKAGIYSVRFASAMLDRMTMPSRLGCGRMTRRANLRRAYVRLLAQMGLLRTGRGWVEYVDLSEALTDGVALAFMSRTQHKPAANPTVNFAPAARFERRRHGANAYIYTRRSLPMRDAGGRFVRADAGMDVAKAEPQAACPAYSPLKAMAARAWKQRRAEKQARRAKQSAARDAAALARAYRPQPEVARPAPMPTPEPPVATVRQPDDGQPADAVWLRDQFSKCKWLSSLNLLSFHGTCFPRGAWRAAVGAMVKQAPGSVIHPARYVHGMVRKIAEGKQPDPRGRPGYFVFAGWGRATLRFANVTRYAR